MYERIGLAVHAVRKRDVSAGRRCRFMCDVYAGAVLRIEPHVHHSQQFDVHAVRGGLSPREQRQRRNGMRAVHRGRKLHECSHLQHGEHVGVH